MKKNSLLASVQCKLLHTNENHELTGKILNDQIEKDIKEGLIPFFV